MKWNFNQSITYENTLYRKYHLQSNHAPHIQMINAPRREYAIHSLDSVGAKVKYKLKSIENLPSLEVELSEVLKKRRSSWVFSELDLTFEMLEQLLTYSFGISNIREKKRTYPSGGQFYPIEVYFVPTARSVDSNLLEEKVYKYNIDHQEIVEICDFNIDDLKAFSASTDVGFFSIDGCQIVLFLVAEDKDIFAKYLEFTYRIIHLDAGHMAQNFLLTSAALGLSSIPIGGFYEKTVKQILGLDNTSKMVIYTLLGG
ncbi:MULTISPECIES: SagB/ThcOx family dehydrogenase [Bacillus]|uniref:SagB/ThcOx family dehydrogenase n=1 Tax=Bacillus TaxID=1386 RepID=UPI0007F87C3F|nr:MULTISPECIES: SagB/ThcOx family dehydrogenase [Bacillus]MCR6615948.1 SagB/ThcOx family dehydrogenase [Bacillus amyloliquefaciens]MCT6684199.1 SagB/ThcOx family dehydrogenase [Bacillus velezensis]MCV2523484.1 SagB/ThcOx family dehydrogenase [Bacillus velezensis]MDQ8057825.1 SagB/ThcOx family dehydrogenase [Bacillus velezensis]MEC0384435.1 SagB/ThcOx family dehydrogenase [Bacillus velezensis]